MTTVQETIVLRGHIIDSLILANGKRRGSPNAFTAMPFA